MMQNRRIPTIILCALLLCFSYLSDAFLAPSRNGNAITSFKTARLLFSGVWGESTTTDSHVRKTNKISQRRSRRLFSTTTTVPSSNPITSNVSTFQSVSPTILPPVIANDKDNELIENTQQFIRSLQNACNTGSPLSLFQWFTADSEWKNPVAENINVFKESFQWLLSTFLEPKVQVFEIKVLAEWKVQIRYQLSVTQALPWRPRIIIPATADITFANNLSDQKVLKVEEKWSITVNKMYQQQVLPRFWDLYHVFSSPHAEYLPTTTYPIATPFSINSLFQTKPKLELVEVPETMVYQAVWYAPKYLQGPPLSVIPSFSMFGNITLNRKISDPMYTMTNVEISSAQFVDRRTQEDMKLYRWRFHVPTAVQDKILPLLKKQSSVSTSSEVNTKVNSYIQQRPSYCLPLRAEWVNAETYSPESDLEEALVQSTKDINPLVKVLLNLNDVGNDYSSDEDISDDTEGKKRKLSSRNKNSMEYETVITSSGFVKGAPVEEEEEDEVINDIVEEEENGGDTDIAEFEAGSLQEDRVQLVPPQDMRRSVSTVQTFVPGRNTAMTTGNDSNNSNEGEGAVVETTAGNALNGNVITAKTATLAEANDAAINRMLLLRSLYAIPNTPLSPEVIRFYESKQRVYGSYAYQPAKLMVTVVVKGREIEGAEIAKALQELDGRLAAGDLRHPQTGKKLIRKPANIADDLVSLKNPHDDNNNNDNLLASEQIDKYESLFTLSPGNVKVSFNRFGQPALAMYDVQFQFRQTKLMVEVIEE